MYNNEELLCVCYDHAEEVECKQEGDETCLASTSRRPHSTKTTMGCVLQSILHHNLHALHRRLVKYNLVTRNMAEATQNLFGYLVLFAYLRVILRASMHFLVLLVASFASIYQTLSAISATRSYAALRAADLDWIVGPGYSLGAGTFWRKPMKNQPGTMKNHGNQPKTMKLP